jgi:DNA-binding transcriptional LysR family regulator
MTCQFVALHDGAFEAMERGRLDLALNADAGHTPDRFHREAIYEDDFVCVVAKASRYSRRLTLKQYLAGLHVGVGVLTGRQSIPEQRLAALGRGAHAQSKCRSSRRRSAPRMGPMVGNAEWKDGAGSNRPNNRRVPQLLVSLV